MNRRWRIPTFTVSTTLRGRQQPPWARLSLLGSVRCARMFGLCPEKGLSRTLWALCNSFPTHTSYIIIGVSLAHQSIKSPSTRLLVPVLNRGTCPDSMLRFRLAPASGSPGSADLPRPHSSLPQPLTFLPCVEFARALAAQFIVCERAIRGKVDRL